MDEIVGCILTVIPLINLLQLQWTHAKNILHNGGFAVWNQHGLSYPNKERFLPGPTQSSPEHILQLSAWPWTGCFTILPYISPYKLEGSDASHEGCWQGSMDNEPHCPQVLMAAKAAQSCSHAQHPHGMGKMGSCWMCSNLLPVQTIDIPKLTGNIPTFSSKPKIVCFLWNKKNLLPCLLMTESLGKQESSLHKASHSPWGGTRHEERANISISCPEKC